MAMQRLLSKFWRDCRGNAIIETALMLPLLIAILAGITEFGWSFYQASALERGLRAGATYAARADLPLSANTKTVIGNLIQTNRAS